MPFPTKKDVEIPLLRAIEKMGGEAKRKQIILQVAKDFPDVTDLNKLGDRIDFARYTLIDKAEMDVPSYGIWRIAEKGRERISSGEETIETLRKNIQLGMDKLIAKVQLMEQRIKQKENEIETLSKTIEDLQKPAGLYSIIDDIMVDYERVESATRISYKDRGKNFLVISTSHNKLFFIGFSEEDLHSFCTYHFPEFDRSRITHYQRFGAIKLAGIDAEEVTSMIEVYIQEHKITHQKLKEHLLKLGEANGFETHSEYLCDSFRLDVVWRKKTSVNPTHCFEVHVSGNIYKDIAALKHAYDRWNSNIYLVCEKDFEKNYRSLLTGTHHEIKEIIGILDSRRVMEYCKSKVEFKDIDKLLSK